MPNCFIADLYLKVQSDCALPADAGSPATASTSPACSAVLLHCRVRTLQSRLLLLSQPSAVARLYRVDGVLVVGQEGEEEPGVGGEVNPVPRHQLAHSDRLARSSNSGRES